jgi:hypothetical protein
MNLSAVRDVIEIVAEKVKPPLQDLGYLVTEKSQPYVQTVEDNVTRHWKIYLEEYIFIGLILLSLVGVFISDFSPIITFWFWLTMIPLFGATAILSAWSHGLESNVSVTRLILTQIIHWGGAIIALVTTYSLWATGRFTDEHTGYIILLLLALTTFTAGVHAGWRFYIAGIFLFVGGIITTHVREYIWVLLLVLMVPLAIFGIVWEKLRKKAPPASE